MKRFLCSLLFVAFVVVLYAPCRAADVAVNVTAIVKPAPHLTVSEPFYGSLASLSYPAEVYLMTPGEFYIWASEQNARARLDWEEWYKTAPPRRVSYGAVDYSRHSDGRYPGVHHGGTGYSNDSESYRSYERRFLNPDYVSRPLTIINPFCPPAH